MNNVVKNSKMSPKKSVTAKQQAKSNLTKRKNPDWDNLDRGYRYLTQDMKLPHDQAVAVMGNVVEESQGDYKSVQKNGGGRGLIQWDGRKAPNGRYSQWGSIWASVAKPANVYDSTTDTVKNYWAPWGGLKGDKVRQKFIKAPLKEKARIYAESYLRPGKPRIADRQLSTMQLDSIYNSRIKDIIVQKNGGMLDFLKNGSGIHIKEKNKGKFTSYCGGKVTDECIQKGKNSSNPAIRKRATFADNARHFKHRLGGSIVKYQYGGPGYFLPKNNLQQKFKDKLYNLSRRIMATANNVKDINYDTLPSGEPLEGVAQTTYLLPRHLQKEKFLEYGYKESPGDYGLVKKAVGNRKLPVYQKNPDVISRNELQVVGNPNYTVWFGNSTEALTHAGNYPSAIYHDDQGNLYQKSWDLNDYGGGTGAYIHYSPKEKMMADIGDIIGSPVVVTTGFRPIYTQKGPEDKQANLLDTGEWKPLDNIINSYLNKKGLHIDSYKENGNNIKFLSLPEVIIKGKKQNIKMRSSIKTANARKWKHQLGGTIINESPIVTSRLNWIQSMSDYLQKKKELDLQKKELDLQKKQQQSDMISNIGGMISNYLPDIISSFGRKKSNNNNSSTNSSFYESPYLKTQNKVGTINSNGSMNTGIGGLTYNWNTDTFGSNNIMNGFNKISLT